MIFETYQTKVDSVGIAVTENFYQLEIIIHTHVYTYSVCYGICSIIMTRALYRSRNLNVYNGCRVGACRMSSSLNNTLRFVWIGCVCCIHIRYILYLQTCMENRWWGTKGERYNECGFGRIRKMCFASMYKYCIRIRPPNNCHQFQSTGCICSNIG